jgi:CheY-like chemotaxis protein
MFVEDNETDQLIARKIMQITGFTGTVTIKESGQSALEFLAEAKNHNMQFPDVIFLDARLHNTDSLHFLNAFEDLPAAIKQHCKIVVLSDADIDSRKEIRNFTDHMSVKKVLPKPLTVDTILDLSI